MPWGRQRWAIVLAVALAWCCACASGAGWEAAVSGTIGKCTRVEAEWTGGTGETWLRAMPSGEWAHLAGSGVVNVLNATFPYASVLASGSNRAVSLTPRMVPAVAGGRLLFYYEIGDMRIVSACPCCSWGHADCLRGAWATVRGYERSPTDGLYYGAGTDETTMLSDASYAWLFEPGFGIRQRYPWRTMLVPLAPEDGGPTLAYFCQQFTLAPDNLPDYVARSSTYGFTSWDTTCYVIDATYRVTLRTETRAKDLAVYPPGEWPPALPGTSQVVFSSHTRMFERMLPTRSGSHYVLLGSEDGIAKRGHDATGDHGGPKSSGVNRVALYLCLVTRATLSPLTFSFSPWTRVDTLPFLTVNLDFAVLPSNITVVVWGIPGGAPSVDLSGQAVVVRAFGPTLTPITPEFTPYEYARSASHQHGIAVTALGDDAPYSAFITWNDESASFRVLGRVFSFADPDSSPYPRPETPIIELVPFNEASLSPYSAVAFRRHVSDAVPEAIGVATKFTRSGVARNGFVSCARPLVLTLNAATCATLGGAAPFSMACVAAAVASRATAHGATIRLAAGVWTGCSPGGIRVTAALRIVGVSSGATTIDCGGSGRAFVVDGYAIEASEEEGVRHTTVIAGLTFANGHVELGPGWGAATATGFASGLYASAPAPAPLDPPLGGGCVAVLGLASGSWLEIQDVVFDSCVVSGGLGGGGLFMYNVRDAALTSVTFTGCGAHAPAPDADDTISGGGLYLGFGPGVALYPTDATAQPRGVTMTNVAVVGNSVSASTALGAVALAPTSVGGGGVALASLPLDFRALAFVNTTIENNAVDAPHGGVGGGMAVTDLALHLVVPDLVVRGNTVSASGTGAAGNGAGGGIYFHDCALGATFSDVVVVDNSVAGSGGGVAMSRAAAGLATFTFVRSMLWGNTASDTGGSVAATAVSVALTDATRIGASTAGTRGGGAAFLVTSAAFTVLPTLTLDASSEVVACAAVFGGGVFVEDGVVSLGGAMVGNDAAVGGGGVAVAAGLVSVESTGRVVNNTAPSGSATFSCLYDPACGAAACGLAKSGNPVPRSLVSLGTGAVEHVVYGTGSTHASDAVAIEWGPGKPADGIEIATAATPVEGVTLRALDAWGEPVVSGVVPFELVSADAEELVRILSPTCTFELGSPTCAFAPELGVYAVHPSIIGTPVLLAAVSRTLPDCLAAGPPFAVVLAECGEDEDIVESAGVFSCQATCGLGEHFLFVEAGDGSESASCSPCEAGSYMDVEAHTFFSCKAVPPGFYGFAGATRPHACPRGANCPNGAAIVAAPGWWLPGGDASDNATVVTFFRCASAEACPGGAEYAACGTGYDTSSFLCSKCDTARDYGPLAGRCVKCHTSTTGAIVLVVVLLVCALAVVVVTGVRSFRSLTAMHTERVHALAAGRTPARQHSEVKVITLVKHVISHGQVLALLISMRSVSSSAVSSWLGMLSTMASTSSEWLSATCAVNISWRVNLYAAFVLPVLVVGVAVACASVLRRRGVASAGGRVVVASPLLAIHISSISLFLVYPTVSRSLFTIFHCRSFHGYSARLVVDYDYACYTVEHLLLLTASCVWILIVVIGLPFVAMFAVYGAAKGDRMAGSNSPLVRLSFFHFLVGDFVRGKEWWLLVTTWEKVFVLGVVIFEARSIHQLFLMLTALAITMAVQAYIHPHSHALYASLVCVSYAVLAISISAALLLDPGVGTSSEWRAVAELVIIGSNLAYIAIVVVAGALVVWRRNRAKRTVGVGRSEWTGDMELLSNDSDTSGVGSSSESGTM